MESKIERRIIPVGQYKSFDMDGWSEDLVMGLNIDKDYIRDARMGALNKSMEFYDEDGHRFPATHLLMLKMGDMRLSPSKISMKKHVLWSPTEEQINALARIVRKIPENKDLRELLKGLKTL